MLRKCEYRVLKHSDGIVFIEDTKKGMSLTNDAERVCQEVNKDYPNCRIIYKDTIGRWDEIVYDGKKVRFVLLNQKTLDFDVSFAA